jgi:sugar lactone lactonase YvrE
MKGALFLLHGVTGVCSASRTAWFAVGGEEGGSDGKIWRYDGLQSKPAVFHIGLHYPTALAVRADSGQVIVIEEGIRGVILYGQNARRSLVTVTDGIPAGVAVDDDGFVYFGVNTDEGTAVIRRGTTRGDPETDFYDLGSGGKVGDLILDPTRRGLWCLDSMHGAVLRVPLDGSDPDTVATGLIHPNGISILANARFLAYSSSDGYVLRALRRR